ncbi:MAG: hypothetical protein HXY52_10345 [Nitrospirae bacterium]|jgi:hypothetical protein|nr:hypothetical protein [Nitrospirota bacterium]
METLTIKNDELRQIMRETFIEVLTNRRDLIEDAVKEAIEDVGLGIAIEEGRTGEYTNAGIFKKKLNERIKKAK